MARIWALTGKRRGDNTQVLALAEAVGPLVREIQLDWTAWRLLPNSVLGESLWCVTKESRRQLTAPWPDMVIGIGRRGVPVSRWIKRQSGDATRLVHLGNPRAELSVFDLVVSTPQYRLPAASNVLVMPLPFGPAPEPPPDLATWQQQWRDLPRPLTGLLIGGNAWPYHYTRRFVRRLARDAIATAAGGSVVAITSPRTPKTIARALTAELRPPHRVYGWNKDAPNPYRSLLLLADRLQVSGESVSMISDAARSRKRFEPIRVPQWPVPEVLTLRDVQALVSRIAASDPSDTYLRSSCAHREAIAACRALLSHGC